MKLLKAMAIAFSIYSKIPVPQFEWKEEDMEYMMCFFPWIGGVIGLFFFGWAVLCEKFAVGNVCYALIGAAIPLMISGGFHVDGYMDTMDAFHSYQSREKKAGDFKRFPYRCVCGDHAGSLLYDRYRSNFRNTYPKGSVCSGSRIFSGEML